MYIPTGARSQMVHYMRAWTLVAIHVLLRSVRPDALCDAKGGVRRCRVLSLAPTRTLMVSHHAALSPCTMTMSHVCAFSSSQPMAWPLCCALTSAPRFLVPRSVCDALNTACKTNLHMKCYTRDFNVESELYIVFLFRVSEHGR